ncbi:TATA box-binding protein-associated factor RNA polymerase I subunit B [Cylas formicarius]|uniref:TATA box-binding protein-associated factor RNA polymerase I subunit B n=1 Tax=Cylas formicarius TaxID=197179 RepID=UPI0029588FBF|nr:TATA box-binding protein-associated factor RNA polymerase I subunit B [Cylas formicarius]
MKRGDSDIDAGHPELQCGVCGGTSFHVESGFYYCTECQTQTQELQEHVFEEEASNRIKRQGKIIGKKEPARKTEVLTSWECYNVILKSLTDQLISLGADGSLKQVVRCLWMGYLNKCEVFSLDQDTRPKLTLVSSKRDIAVVCGVKKKKRRSRRSSTGSDNTTDTVLSRRQRTLKKMALMKSDYQEASQTLTQDSMMSETLSSLKSNSTHTEKANKIQYNTHSKHYLKKRMAKEHIKEHRQDLRKELKCHKMTYKHSYKFAVGPSVITIGKLYQILYLGLNITRSDIQLGDMLRFIREGHLSFGAFFHLFPEDVKVHMKKHQHLVTFTVFRDKIAGLAKFLDLTVYVEMPNLITLCARYCKELNLPLGVLDCVKKLILKTRPLMTFNSMCNRLPNYEARAMAFIILTLKILFGLDGMTESKLSRYSNLLNEKGLDSLTFNIEEWLKYLQYRRCVIEKYHLPTRLGTRKEFGSDLYLEYINSQKLNYKQGVHYIQKESKDYQQVLARIRKDSSLTQGEPIVFPPTLTPFLSYSQVVGSNRDVPLRDLLWKDFSENSLRYLLEPDRYLEMLNNHRIVADGANANVVLHPPCSFLSNKGPRSCLRRNKKVVVHISDETVYNSGTNHRNGFPNENNDESSPESTSEVDYDEHYRPFERFWLNIPANPVHFDSYMASKDMEDYMTQIPFSFKLVINECRRIIEQDIECVFSEYLVTELNLAYGTKIAKLAANMVGDTKLRTLLKSCASKW